VATFSYSGEEDGNTIEVTKDFVVTKLIAEKGENAVDYILNVTPNIFNSDEDPNPDIYVTVTKKDGSNVDDITDGAIENKTLEYSYDGNNWVTLDENQFTWKPQFTHAQVRFEVATNIYEYEDITVLKNGEMAKDFNITASAYALKKGENGEYLNSITLTAHKINIADTVSVFWYQKVGDNYIEIDTDDAKDENLLVGVNGLGAGEYKATCSDFVDYVTIVEIEDGAVGPDGKPAISIILSNPNMTFHAPANGSTSGQSE
jgi:hypothetical protein